ncbi:hypothetical protein WG66_011991 [Moniliophthora roreri]|nr:hypothetical protein WG66_011991 [Moniliophthora roreri]
MSSPYTQVPLPLSPTNLINEKPATASETTSRPIHRTEEEEKRPSLNGSLETLLKEVTRHDEDMVKAGLFSAAQWLDEGPADAAVVLLTQLISVQVSSSQSVPFEHTRFRANALSIGINVFWFLSFILSFASALFGLLCKQWIREHQCDTNTRSSSLQPPSLSYQFICPYKSPQLSMSFYAKKRETYGLTSCRQSRISVTVSAVGPFNVAGCLDAACRALIFVSRSILLNSPQPDLTISSSSLPRGDQLAVPALVLDNASHVPNAIPFVDHPSQLSGGCTSTAFTAFHRPAFRHSVSFSRHIMDTCRPDRSEGESQITITFQ